MHHHNPQHPRGENPVQPQYRKPGCSPSSRERYGVISELHPPNIHFPPVQDQLPDEIRADQHNPVDHEPAPVTPEREENLPEELREQGNEISEYFLFKRKPEHDNPPGTHKLSLSPILLTEPRELATHAHHHQLSVARKVSMMVCAAHSPRNAGSPDAARGYKTRDTGSPHEMLYTGTG